MKRERAAREFFWKRLRLKMPPFRPSRGGNLGFDPSRGSQESRAIGNGGKQWFSYELIVTTWKQTVTPRNGAGFQSAIYLMGWRLHRFCPWPDI
jgi:hypothetical protein